MVKAERVPAGALTEIHEGAVIGKNAEILGGVSIGQFARIRAKSRVIGDVPPWAVVSRSPAIMEGYICSECSELMHPIGLPDGAAMRLHCGRCATPALLVSQAETKKIGHVLFPNGACGPLVNMAGDDFRWQQDWEVR